MQQVGGALGVGVIGILYYGSLAEGSSTAFLHGLTYLIAVALVLAGLAQLLPRAASVPSASSHASGASREGVQS